MKMLGHVACFALLLPGILPLAVHAADEPLKLHAPIEIPDSRGGFEALEVDSDKRRLLLAHTGNGTLDAIDLNTEKVLKPLKTGAASSLLVDAGKNRYFVGIGSEKKLLIVDRSSFTNTGQIALPGAPGALCLGPSGVNRLFVARADGAALWVVDPDARAVVSTLEVPSGPRCLVVEDDASRVFLTVNSDDSVQVISAADNNSTIGGSWPTAPARRPHGVALDLRGERRLFVAGVNGKVAVLRVSDGNALGSADIVTGTQQMAFDAAKDRLYCATSSGKITVLDTSGQSIRRLGDVTTVRGAKALTIDPKTHAVWIAYTEDGKCFARKLTLP